MPKILLPAAWELTQKELERQLFILKVPLQWQQVAKFLAQQRAKLQGKGYRSVPVYSLDPLIAASFPQVIQTVRYSWQKPGIPWLFATEPADLSDLPLFVKDWLIEEFSLAISEDELESSLNQLNDEDWHWEEPENYYFLNLPETADQNILYYAIPDCMAEEFLKKPTVCFGCDNQYELTFYRVVRLKGSELMSWPPCPVSVTNKNKKQETELAYISFAISFQLQTVPGRKQPIIYPQLSVRRWITRPLISQENNEEKIFVPYPGVNVYVGDRYRWLDGKQQPFCFMPIQMKRHGQELKWPKPIDRLLELNDTQLPKPKTFALEPQQRWTNVTDIEDNLQAAIAYTSKLGKHPGNFGVSPLDLASLDRAIQEKLPVRRVGEGIQVSPFVDKSFWPPGKSKKKGDKTSKAPNDRSIVMSRPEIAAPAAFRDKENPIHTILILWETETCRDALLEELCQRLDLSPTEEKNLYSGTHGSLYIQTKYVDDLGERLDIDSSVPKKNRQKRRAKLLQERSDRIALSLPKYTGISGALIEIKPKPKIPEADPKLAWRIGAIKAGYVNQHIHRLTYINKSGEEKFTKDAAERVQRAVGDLLRQFGILPAPLITEKIDKIDPHIWLTCFYVLRRTRKTTASGVPNTVALMVRVNPILGTVQFTTPSLFRDKGWVSSCEVFPHLLSQKWDVSGEEKPDWDKKKEQNLLNKFIANCLRDCLNTPIDGEQLPKVLFMVEAQNARLMLPWLQNPKLPANSLPHELKQHIDRQESDRLWIVRVRCHNNGEVPFGLVQDESSPGNRKIGLFRWEGVGDSSDFKLYLSKRKLLTTEQDVLRKAQSRLDDGSASAGNTPLLEIAVVHSPGIDPDKLAYLAHHLRDRWPYFPDQVTLPFPFTLAIKAKEYAVSAKGWKL